jgi:hypothetical protein
VRYFKNFSLIIGFVSLSLIGFAQKKGSNFDLTNAVIVGQFDKQEDRYSVEANLSELFNSTGIKAMPSLNLVKIGQDAATLASDSVLQVVKEKGYDTYVIINVRGYDRKFKPSTTKLTLQETLERGSLYSIHQPDIVSVTFEVRVFRNGAFVGVDSIKCGNVGERDSVLRRLRGVIEKRLKKSWK